MLHPLRPAGAATRPAALAIGVFDGVHLGHRALLARTCQLAADGGLMALAFTFDPHPAAQLAPARAPPLIEPLDCRLGQLAACGLDAAWVQPFVADFAALTPAAFAERVLAGACQARHVVVGEGFTFGHHQSGDVAALAALGGRCGFAVHAVAPVHVDGSAASSTRVRALLRAGEAAAAARLLGRDFALVGCVEPGAQRGRTLGFPTANLRPRNALQPAPGVYAGRCALDGAPPERPCVVNIGTAPTFGALPEPRVEAHLLGYDGPDFYGRSLQVALHARLRAERRFAGRDALVAQIHADVAAAEAALEADP